MVLERLYTAVLALQPGDTCLHGAESSLVRNEHNSRLVLSFKIISVTEGVTKRKAITEGPVDGKSIVIACVGKL